MNDAEMITQAPKEEPPSQVWRSFESFSADSDHSISFWENAFSRNFGILNQKEMKILRQSRVGIAGLGGMGGTHLMTLVRTGIGKYNLAEFDSFEIHNTNRQVGARVDTIGKRKLDVMKDDALKVNPFLEITSFPEGLTEESLDKFLDGVDVVLDGLDAFSIHIRRRLFNRAREKGIPVVTAGPMGFGAAVLIFVPDGMGFDQYFDIKDGMSEEEMLLSFFSGLSPKLPHLNYMDPSKVSLRKKQGPSLGLSCQIAAGIAATEVIRLLTGRGKIYPAPFYITFDPFLHKYNRGRLWFGNANPWRRLYRKVAYWWLQRRGSR